MRPTAAWLAVPANSSAASHPLVGLGDAEDLSLSMPTCGVADAP